MALCVALTIFQHLIDGFHNRNLRLHVGHLLASIPIVPHALAGKSRDSLRVGKLASFGPPWPQWATALPDTHPAVSHPEQTGRTVRPASPMLCPSKRPAKT